MCFENLNSVLKNEFDEVFTDELNSFFKELNVEFILNGVLPSFWVSLYIYVSPPKF